MKSLLKILFVLGTLSFIFYSCQSTSVMKRRYNKGFYVSRSHAPAELKKQQTNTQVAAIEKSDVLPAQINALPGAGTEELKTSREERGPACMKAAKKFFAHKKAPAAEHQTAALAVNDKSDPDAGLGKKHLFGASGADREDDALSLMWLLIIALLVLYVIGIFTEGFGLGGIIHILGVIIVVLLVLWLLRLI